MFRRAFPIICSFLIAAPLAARTWTTNDGATREGNFVRVVEGNVAMLSGVEIVEIPYAELSAGDQEYVREKLVAKGQVDLIPPLLPKPRDWTDIRGHVLRNAVYVFATEKSIYLRPEGGRTVAVPLASISKADLENLRKELIEIDRLATLPELPDDEPLPEDSSDPPPSDPVKPATPGDPPPESVPARGAVAELAGKQIWTDWRGVPFEARLVRVQGHFLRFFAIGGGFIDFAFIALGEEDREAIRAAEANLGEDHLLPPPFAEPSTPVRRWAATVEQPEGKYVDFREGNVLLRTGRSLDRRIEFSKLSQEDQEYVRQRLADAGRLGELPGAATSEEPGEAASAEPYEYSSYEPPPPQDEGPWIDLTTMAIPPWYCYCPCVSLFMVCAILSLVKILAFITRPRRRR